MSIAIAMQELSIVVVAPGQGPSIVNLENLVFNLSRVNSPSLGTSEETQKWLFHTSSACGEVLDWHYSKRLGIGTGTPLYASNGAASFSEFDRHYRSSKSGCFL